MKMNNVNWKNKTTAFIISQAITMFGSSLVQFAIIWYIAKTTESGLMVTLQAISSFLPQVLISLFAGVWADRYNRKLLIAASDGMIAISTLILAILMMNGFESIWIFLVISAIRSIGSGIQSPAVNAVLPQIVPEDKLMKVTGINGSVQSMINLVAPAAAGALLSYSAIYNLMFIDVVTAIIGISILLFIKIGLHEKALLKEKGGYFKDLKEGIKYSYNHMFVKNTILLYIAFTILIVPAAFLNVLMVTRVFGSEYIYLTLNEIAFFLGAMAGGVLLGTWGGFNNRMKTFILGLTLFGVLTIAIGFIDVFWIYLIIMVFTGISMPLSNSPIMVMLQEKVDTNMQGRVFSLLQIVFSLFLPIGIAVFGPLADIMPIQYLMIGSGIAMLILAYAIYKHKHYYNEGIPSKVDITVENN